MVTERLLLFDKKKAENVSKMQALHIYRTHVSVWFNRHKDRPNAALEMMLFVLHRRLAVLSTLLTHAPRTFLSMLRTARLCAMLFQCCKPIPFYLEFAAHISLKLGEAS